MERYKIITPFKGSSDGAHVFDYARGDVVPNENQPFSEDLAQVALRNNWARKHVPPKVEKQKDSERAGEMGAEKRQSAAVTASAGK